MQPAEALFCRRAIEMGGLFDILRIQRNRLYHERGDIGLDDAGVLASSVLLLVKLAGSDLVEPERLEPLFDFSRRAFPPDWQQLPDSEDCEGLSDCYGYYPFRAVFTQDEGTVTGSLRWFEPPDFEIPEWTWTVQDGSVSIEGTLSLTFDEVAFPAFLSETPFEIRHRLVSWKSRADTPGVLKGTAQMHLTANELSDSVVADGYLGSERLHCSGWRRDGQQAAAAGSMGTRRGGLFPRPGRQARSGR